MDLSHSMRAPQLYSPDASVAIASRSHGDGLGVLANDAVRVTRAASRRHRITPMLLQAVNHLADLIIVGV